MTHPPAQNTQAGSQRLSFAEECRRQSRQVAEAGQTEDEWAEWMEAALNDIDDWLPLDDADPAAVSPLTAADKPEGK